ncbi:MAG TPA: hypothetical protein VFV86_09805 [Nitrososphaeraceae archaeon]|nr:hypothetical protein [Nitrososphaeraceae archaeon]
MKHHYDFKWSYSFLISIGILTIFSNTSFLGHFVYADDLNPGVYSKDSKPFGIPYGEWLEKHTRWLFQVPLDIHPGKNYTTENCASNQSGPVWFLTLNFEKGEQRTCIIPSDKAILLPILAGFCGEWDLTYMESLTSCAKAGNEFGTISASVDGKEIKDLESYRAQSPIFNITLQENNVLGHTPGSGKAQNDGFYLFLEPLSPGNHTVHTSTNVNNIIAPGFNYDTDLTYHLIITP